MFYFAVVVGVDGAVDDAVVAGGVLLWSLFWLLEYVSPDDIKYRTLQQAAANGYTPD